MSKNAVTKTNPAPLTVAPEPQGQTTAILSSQDELFSVARMIQAMSKAESCANPNGADFVKGDVVVYPQRYKIGGFKQPFSVIFLRNTLEWANFEIVAAKEEWRSEEPRIDRVEAEGGNEHWPMEFTFDGKKMKRYRQITLYVLLPFQVEAFMKDALSDTPHLTGSVSPIALKARNFSRKALQEILNVVAGKEFVARNALRRQNGLPEIPVYGYEHMLEPENKTNAKGTFQILSYKGSTGVKSNDVRTLAKIAYDTIAKKQNLKTVVMEEVQASTQPFNATGEEIC